MGRVTRVPLVGRPLELDRKGLVAGTRRSRLFFSLLHRFPAQFLPRYFPRGTFRSWETYTQRVLIFCLPDAIDSVIIHGCGEVLESGEKRKRKKGKHYHTLEMVFTDELPFHYRIFSLFHGI